MQFLFSALFTNYLFQCFNAPTGDDALMKFWGFHNTQIPQWQRWLLKLAFPVLRSRLGKVLNITPEGAADGMAKTKKFFEETDAMLSDGRKYIMGTEEPTYVDVALASLGAILLMPDEYGGNTFGSEMRPIDSDFNQTFLKAKKEFAKTPTGKFILKMFKEHRF